MGLDRFTRGVLVTQPHAACWIAALLALVFSLVLLTGTTGAAGML